MNKCSRSVCNQLTLHCYDGGCLDDDIGLTELTRRLTDTLVDHAFHARAIHRGLKEEFIFYLDTATGERNHPRHQVSSGVNVDLINLVRIKHNCLKEHVPLCLMLV